MKIHCPHCEKSMRVKDPRPGAYKPACRGCGERFRLIVDERGNGTAKPLLDPLAQGVSTREATQITSEETLDSSLATQPVEKPPATPHPPTAAAASTEIESPSAAATVVPAATSAIDETIASTPDDEPADGTLAATGTENALSDMSFALSPEARGSQALPDQIGGYRVLKELGRGAMGVVYSARQISLAREVALKTIQAKWADNPRMLARFMREAYAAAQLTHHNMVQIYDLGEENRMHYFSMELVAGCNLSQLVRRRGRLPATEAIGLILQAARGLEAAHNQGLVHRDVKPSNLLLSDTGIVKVADLGLVKIANQADITGDGDDPASVAHHTQGDLTLAHNAMGTALFMAPEQSDDASSVDHRADIYSLGCTLYVLLTGRPPFMGDTAVELITKHKTMPVERPDFVVGNISSEVSDAVMRMVAKDPSERFASMAEVIVALERALEAAKASEGAAPDINASATNEVAELARSFASATAAKRQSAAAWGAVAGGGLLGAAALAFNPAIGIGLLGAVAAGSFTRQLLKSRGASDGVLSKARQWLGTAATSDYVTWGIGLIMVLAGLWALKLIVPLLISLLVGVGCGAAFAMVIDRAAAAQQSPILKDANALLQRLRLDGHDEQKIREVVANHSSRAFAESLFGYKAARESRGRGLLSVRDLVHDFFEKKILQSKQSDQQLHLQQVEQRRLESEGVDADEARQRAEDLAASLAAEVAQLRREAKQLQAVGGNEQALAAKEKRERMKTLLAEGRELSDNQVRSRRLTRTLLNTLIGGRNRFVLGAILLAGCFLWVQDNELVDKVRSIDGIKDLVMQPAETTKPLFLPVVGSWFNTIHVGLAGLMLVFSAQYGWRNALTSIPAACIVFAGPSLGVPGLGLPGGAWTVSAAAGLLLFCIGIYFTGDDDY